MLPAPGLALQQPRIRACGVITLYRSNIAVADPIGYSEACCFPGFIEATRGTRESLLVSAGD